MTFLCIIFTPMGAVIVNHVRKHRRKNVILRRRGGARKRVQFSPRNAGQTGGGWGGVPAWVKGERQRLRRDDFRREHRLPQAARRLQVHQGAEEVTGKRKLTGFSRNVILDEEVTCDLRSLHGLVMKGSNGFGKEELCCP